MIRHTRFSAKWATNHCEIITVRESLLKNNNTDGSIYFFNLNKIKWWYHKKKSSKKGMYLYLKMLNLQSCLMSCVLKTLRNLNQYLYCFYSENHARQCTDIDITHVKQHYVWSFQIGQVLIHNIWLFDQYHSFFTCVDPKEKRFCLGSGKKGAKINT